MPKEVKIYVCGVDWQHELGQTHVTAYCSKKDIEKHRGCTEGCGLVEITITEENIKWLIPQDGEKMYEQAEQSRDAASDSDR